MATNATGTMSLPLPRGADWSRLVADKVEIDQTGIPTRLRYDGLPVLADGLDVHEIAFDLLASYVNRGDAVLDVGAGSGAFSKRLLNNGFGHVEAVEVNRKVFRVPQVPLHAFDLDSPWAGHLAREFSGLVAIEVIEHLENPWEFARQCAAALRPGGVAVISTPNIQSTRSRIEFLVQAEFRFFREADYHRMGHLTSLTKDQMVRVFDAAGFAPLDYRRSRHKGLPVPRGRRSTHRCLLYLLTRPFMRYSKAGEVSLFAFRRV